MSEIRWNVHRNRVKVRERWLDRRAQEFVDGLSAGQLVTLAAIAAAWVDGDPTPEQDAGLPMLRINVWEFFLANSADYLP